jgi:hypothetical protein
VSARKPGPNAYDRTGYSDVAGKFIICVQREGSHSITTDDCKNLLSLRDALYALTSENARLREALTVARCFVRTRGHSQECFDSQSICECGYDDALAALAGSEK